MTAISAAAMRCRTMADGSLRIEVEVEPRDAQQAFALFGMPGAPMALAALAVGHASVKEPEPVKPKGGERAKWVAMRCNEPEFQAWIKTRWPDITRMIDSRLNARDAAASIVRTACNIDSRAELDADPHVSEWFDDNIRKRWAAHSGVTA